MVITLSILRQEGIQNLGGLPCLHFLCLTVLTTDSAEERIIVGIDQARFQSLSDFSFCNYKMGLTFAQGAMRKLEKLEVTFRVRGRKDGYGDFDLGLENLSSVNQVFAKISCTGSTLCDVEDADSAMRKATDMNMNHPKLEVMNYYEDEMTEVKVCCSVKKLDEERDEVSAGKVDYFAKLVFSKLAHIAINTGKAPVPAGELQSKEETMEQLIHHPRQRPVKTLGQSGSGTKRPVQETTTPLNRKKKRTIVRPAKQGRAGARDNPKEAGMEDTMDFPTTEKNPTPQLVAQIKELEADLEQEYEHRTRTKADHQDTLRGVHNQLEALGEEWNSLFEQNKKLAANLKETKQIAKNAEGRATGYHNSFNQVQAKLEKVHKEKEELEASLQLEQTMHRDGDA
ncbi:hypothetical protein BAE44_0023962 [Dichanthelium oligosanthes]|uniref:Disease resistance R13L4/SHOC-2-like LRR domain-containing protein n=1 Tax=Dichanthelium oligosanthes TaxID=888268 RepID=A0A1E5UQ45_9POAL|nr:hypothetical protein BAE44_0023962 [Dichanthelium oligosanthes]